MAEAIPGPPSLQTDGPVARLPLSSGQEPIVGIATRTNLILDPPYQRGSVWGTLRRRRLVYSLLLWLPVGALLLNTRDDGRLSVAVVDGRQRLETVLMFLDDRLSVPATWWPMDEVAAAEDTDDGPYVRWSGLTAAGRGRLERASVTTVRTEVDGVAEEAVLFGLVNSAGLEQGARDDDR